MGQTPAKMFGMPQPFGSSPQGNNVSQVQPLAVNQGPGFAAASGFNQQAQTPPAPDPGFDGGGFQNILNSIRQGRFGGGGSFPGMMRE